MEPEIQEFDKIDLSEIKSKSYESSCGKLLKCFEYDHLDASVNYIGFIYQYTALYTVSKLDENDEGTFKALLLLLRSRNEALYQYFEQSNCK
jgi:hypothetical protein